ncbi:MAG: hypothetical protein AB1515_03705 [Nitrospirota bacterium]
MVAAVTLNHLIALTVAAVVIAAGLLIWRGRRERQLSLTLVGLILLFLPGVIVWAVWLTPPSEEPAVSLEEEQALLRAAQMALPTDTPEVIIQKMGCAVCHKIPAIRGARVGVVGPVLILRTTAAQRLASPEYQARVKAGLAHATTPKEYVIESIVDPGAFIVPGFELEKNPKALPMYPHYRERFTDEALTFLALFLLQLDEELARQEGLLE